MPRILIATVLVAGLVAVAVGHAAGQSAPAPLWATVNSCGPNEMGVRASLPGNGTRQRMRVRFLAEWYSHDRQGWVPVDGVASSPWLDAGSAQYKYQQTGWTFDIAPPASGHHYLLRGIAEMQWLSEGRVVRNATLVTRSGAAGVSLGGSSASCSIG